MKNKNTKTKNVKNSNKNVKTVKVKTIKTKLVKTIKDIPRSVGAPSKPVHWPSTPFTLDQLVKRNSKLTKQSRISLYKKTKEGVKSGEVIELVYCSRHGVGAGRPKFRFVMSDNFDKKRMARATPIIKATKNIRMVEVPMTVPKSPVVAEVVAQVTSAPVMVAPVIEAELVHQAPMIGDHVFQAIG